MYVATINVQKCVIEMEQRYKFNSVFATKQEMTSIAYRLKTKPYARIGTVMQIENSHICLNVLAHVATRML